MVSLWIIHRDARVRAALARLAGAGEESVLGAPSDAHFEALVPPDVVVLGLAGDLESELEFVHRFGLRMPGASWLLLAEPSLLSEARRLFDAVPAELLRYPPTSEAIRAHLRDAVAHRRVESLSARWLRDAVASQFSRYFADLELPELLRALDPRLAEVPVLIQGEVGTGRSLLARYVHAFGGTTGGAFRALDCERAHDVESLRRDVERAAETEGFRSALTLCFEEVDRMAPALQRELADWVTLAPPAAALRSPRLRFIATAGDPDLGEADRHLDPRLLAALSGLFIRIPPLRQRPDAIAAFATETAAAWCQEQGQRPRTLSPDAIERLTDHPWPTNLRELESVVVRTLASSSVEPIRADHLRFDVAGPELASPAAPAVSHPVTRAEDGSAAEGTSRKARVATMRDSEEEIAETELIFESGRGRTPVATPEVAEKNAGAALRRLANALAHEVRNPLVAIRTFAELLPERFEDEEFRTRFAESVKNDVDRLEELMTKLSGLGSLGSGKNPAVDVASLLDELLEARRESIQARRILVLKELDRTDRFAVADPAQLRMALDCLIEKALALIPERGDAYVASKHHATGLRGGPSIRILVRFQGPGPLAGEALEDVSVAETSLDLVVAEALIRAQGGSFQLDSSEGDESLVVIDLPAPPSS